MSNSWDNGGGKQRKTCKCGHFKACHAIKKKQNGTNEYFECEECDCNKFRAKAKGEL